MNISIPVTIDVPKIPGCTDSIFYADKTIAHVTVLNRDYALIATGEYKFSIGEKEYDSKSCIVKKLTDKKISRLDRDGYVSNWGWFGIGLWNKTNGKWEYQITPTDCYSRYDEALKAFKEYVEKDLRERTEK